MAITANELLNLFEKELKS